MGGESSLKPLLQRQTPHILENTRSALIGTTGIVILEREKRKTRRKRKKKKARVSALETGNEIPQFRRVSWPVRVNLVWP